MKDENVSEFSDVVVGKKDNYFVWLWKQLHGWPIQNYILFAVSVGFQLGLYVSGKFDLLTTLTLIGTTLGVLCVVSINAVKAVNGWLGLVSAACFIYISYTATNYLAIFEQLAYVLTLDLPVIFATKTWNADTVNHIRTFKTRALNFGKGLTIKWNDWATAILATLAVYGISGYLISFTNDGRPWVDAIAFAISLTAGIMCFFRFNNQYYWWAASGVFQLILWTITFSQGDATIAMAINSLIYLANDVIAFMYSPWFKDKKWNLFKNNTVDPAIQTATTANKAIDDKD